ncbi:MAG: HEPN domain-containing protein [Chloroflexi bacterium]|nr:HEPN domain-containing protein [Chloroflexota bacterium]
MNRSDLQRLAEERLDAAKALFQSARYSGAYYLAGYAVECGLKACIARQIRQYEYPPSATYSRDLFTHSIRDLVRLAGLSDVLAARMRHSPQFSVNWEDTLKWSEQSRYESWTMQEAWQLLAAVDAVPDGVLEWTRQHW